MVEQRHKDRLSALDASFLINERSGVGLHAGALLILEGPPMSYAELVNQIESRAHLFPRTRQKLAFPPLKTGRPIWVDDVHFDIERHIHQADLPEPGSEKELSDLVGRVFSRQLDMTSPPWEFWLVRGLSENRFTLLCKLHHCMVDGISGVNLSKVLFDLEPTAKSTMPAKQEWIPSPAPSKLEMAIDGIREELRQLLSILSFVARGIKHPMAAVRRRAAAAAGLIALARALVLKPAPETLLNVEIGQERSVEWVRFDLDQFKRLKDTVGTTVNDVVLAVIASGLARFFKRRGQQTEGLKLLGLVPVSVRAKDDPSLFGNLMVAVRGPLPLDAEDPIQLLKRIHAEMMIIKESGELTGADVISAVNDYLPPILLAQTSRLNFSTRLFNLITTNLPGLQVPLYVRGRRMLDFFPVTCLPDKHALAIAVMSYNGSINFNFLADSDVLPDLQLLREDAEQAFEELLEAATCKATRSAGGKGDGKKKTPADNRKLDVENRW